MDMGNITVWYNLVFWAFIAAAAVLGFASAFSGHFHVGHVGGHDVGAHVGGHDAGGHHVHLGHGEHIAHNGDASHPSGFSRAFNVLGIGRAPIMIVMLVMLILFGVIGLMSNMIFQSMRLPPDAFFLFSTCIAAFGSVILTGRIAAVVGRFMPSDESYAVTPLDLVGLSGTAVLETTQDTGAIQVYDQYRTHHQYLARSSKGTIAKGQGVILEEYKSEGDYFIVSEVGLV